MSGGQNLTLVDLFGVSMQRNLHRITPLLTVVAMTLISVVSLRGDEAAANMASFLLPRAVAPHLMDIDWILPDRVIRRSNLWRLSHTLPLTNHPDAVSMATVAVEENLFPVSLL